MTLPAPPGPVEPPEAAARSRCPHDWRLLEVEFEDGRCTHVYGCLTCRRQRLTV